MSANILQVDDDPSSSARRSPESLLTALLRPPQRMHTPSTQTTTAHALVSLFPTFSPLLFKVEQDPPGTAGATREGRTTCWATFLLGVSDVR